MERGEKLSLNQKREPLRHNFQYRENFHYFRQKHESPMAILMSAPIVPQDTTCLNDMVLSFLDNDSESLLSDLFCRSAASKISAHPSDKQNI